MKTSRLAVALSSAALLAAVSGSPALARRPRVRRVCNGSTVPCPPGGHHKTIAHALRRARSGDWILVWPGVYHEKQTDRQGNLLPDGLLITTPSIHLRGLDRFPAGGFRFFAVPVKVRGMGTFPVRAFGLVEEPT